MTETAANEDQPLWNEDGAAEPPEELEEFYGAPTSPGATSLEQLLEGLNPDPVSYTHLTLPTNREV